MEGLASVGIRGDRLGRAVGAGREELSIGNAGEHLPTTAPPEDEDDPTKGFFDQDR